MAYSFMVWNLSCGRRKQMETSSRMIRSWLISGTDAGTLSSLVINCVRLKGKNRPANQQGNNGNCRSRQEFLPGWYGAVVRRQAKELEQRVHGIESGNSRPDDIRQAIFGIDDGSQVKPGCQDDLVHVTHIRKGDANGAQQQPDAQRK